jgi:hypothetical protein
MHGSNAKNLADRQVFQSTPQLPSVAFFVFRELYSGVINCVIDKLPVSDRYVC